MKLNLINKNLPNIESPVFIWGSPRSGTTLLNQLLAKHPDFAYPKNSQGDPVEGTKIWYDALGYITRGELKKRPSRIAENRLKRKYSQLLREQDKKRILSKVLLIPLWMDFANEVFPDARHIHIIRDGRAVLNSILYKINHSQKTKDKVFLERKQFFGPQPAEIDALKTRENLTTYHVMQWTTLVMKGLELADTLGDRYYQIYYEDLVKAPRDYIKDIFNFCELKKASGIMEDIPENLVNRNSKWKSFDDFQGLPQKDQEAFTKMSVLTSDELQLFYQEPTYSLMKALNYDMD